MGVARRRRRLWRRQELHDLYNAMENSHDELFLSDFVAFFRGRGARHGGSGDSGGGGSGPAARLAVPTSNTITTVHLCADQSFVAIGAIDCVARIYDLRGNDCDRGSSRDSSRSAGDTPSTRRGSVGEPLDEGNPHAAHAPPRAVGGLDDPCIFSHKFAKQIGAVVLSSRGVSLGVGGFGGMVQWVDVASKATLREWDHAGKDVNSLAVDLRDTELIVGGADCAVTIYCVVSGRMLWRFSTLATVWAVSVSEVCAPRGRACARARVCVCWRARILA